MWIDLKGPIVANTVYANGILAAKNVTVTLPAVTPVSADFRAMGTVSYPLIGQIEAMEATITKIGIDLGLCYMMKFESATYEFRWAQDVKQSDGSSRMEGCKAFIRGISKGIPGLSVDPGNASENDVTISATRYQLFVNGVEYWLIDQLNQIMRIYGKDYAKEINNLL